MSKSGVTKVPKKILDISNHTCGYLGRAKFGVGIEAPHVGSGNGWTYPEVDSNHLVLGASQRCSNRSHSWSQGGKWKWLEESALKIWRIIPLFARVYHVPQLWLVAVRLKKNRAMYLAQGCTSKKNTNSPFDLQVVQVRTGISLFSGLKFTKFVHTRP